MSSLFCHRRKERKSRATKRAELLALDVGLLALHSLCCRLSSFTHALVRLCLSCLSVCTHLSRHSDSLRPSLLSFLNTPPAVDHTSNPSIHCVSYYYLYRTQRTLGIVNRTFEQLPPKYHLISHLVYVCTTLPPRRPRSTPLNSIAAAAAPPAPPPPPMAAAAAAPPPQPPPRPGRGRGWGVGSCAGVPPPCQCPWRAPPGRGRSSPPPGIRRSTGSETSRWSLFFVCVLVGGWVCVGVCFSVGTWVQHNTTQDKPKHNKSQKTHATPSAAPPRLRWTASPPPAAPPPRGSAAGSRRPSAPVVYTYIGERWMLLTVIERGGGLESVFLDGSNPSSVRFGGCMHALPCASIYTYT